MIKIHFLGTSGWFDSPAGNTICTMIDAPDNYIILDAGMGIYKIDRFISGNKPITVFLSHFHIDHIAGLHILGKFRFQAGLEIYGPPGTEKYINDIVARPYTIPIADLPMTVRLNDIDRKKPAGINVEYAPLVHSTVCYGYRFDFGRTIVGYCTDTGICPGLDTLGMNADLLICECSFRPGENVGDWPHLRPEDAAAVAVSCGARMLALTHFDASRYPDRKGRRAALRTARRIFPRTVAARDDLTLSLPYFKK